MLGKVGEYLFTIIIMLVSIHLKVYTFVDYIYHDR
jgi:hypothetical protein